MTIELITSVYNEEYLLPIFYNHYNKEVDKFTFLFNSSSTDKSEQILCNLFENNINISITSFAFPDNKLNDEIKRDLFNRAIRNSVCDWVIVVDIDELIFVRNSFDKSIKNTIEKIYKANEKRDYFECSIFNMIPKEGESENINKDIPIQQQRHYGYFNIDYHKPAIFKPNDLRVTVGNHFLYRASSPQYCLEKTMSISRYFLGCHLNCINLQNMIDRRLSRTNLSETNIKRGYGVQYQNINKETLISEYEKNYKKAQRLW